MGEEVLIAMLNILATIGIPLLVIVTAMATGTIIEKRHYRLIKKREMEFRRMPVVPSKALEEGRPVAAARMVTGSVVVSLDYFKRFLASLRQIFGGRIRSYESLVDRGRREAILRMQEKARSADMIVNFRMETSVIGSTNRKGKRKIGCVEVMAYGTAVKYGEVAAE